MQRSKTLQGTGDELRSRWDEGWRGWYAMRRCDGQQDEGCDCGKGDRQSVAERNGAPVRKVCGGGGEAAVCPAGGQQRR
jgi:hypothetical protein